MFEFLKKKKKEKNINLFKLVAPVTGKLLSLTDVPDPVFAQKMAGDGVAVMPEDDVIVAPADGELTLVFDTKHAFAMTLDNGIELLVHIGLETVTLKGKGFEQLIQSGIKIKAGTPIMKVDREYIKSKGFSLITPILITNTDNTKSIVSVKNANVVAGETIILEYTV
jgi:PTS system D-glucosamine-specific IIA component/PTS system glucose-specific IIA component